MKHPLLLLFLLLGAALGAQGSYADQVRNYVRENLIFYYVDNPAAARPGDMGTIEVDKNAIAQGQDITTPLWTNAGNLGLRQLVVKLLRAPANGGDFDLQRITRDALLITNKKVIVYLYNDSANGMPDPTWRQSPNGIYCRYGGTNATLVNKCWPCANFFTDRTLAAGGHMALGSHYFNPASNTTIEDANTKISTFLHELVHTQLKNVIEAQVPVANWYGAPNQGHFYSELLPSKNTAFNEGVASAFAYRYYLPNDQNLIRWLNSNATMWVDSIAGCAGGATPSYHCLMDRFRQAGMPGVAGNSNGILGRRYPIRDIPPELLVHNETVLANLIFEYTRQYNNPLMLVRDIKRAHADINGTTGNNFTFVPLYKQMLLSSKQWQLLNTLETQNSRGEFFTAGITDFCIGYRLANRATLERSFGFTWSNDLPNIDDYFATHRAALLALRHNNTTWAQQQLTDFGTQLHIHQPSPPSATGLPEGGNRP